MKYLIWPKPGGHKISDTTGSNSGYWFLGTTLSVNPNYNRLLCAHYLPGDGVDSLVDMTVSLRILITCEASIKYSILDAVRRGGMGG